MKKQQILRSALLCLFGSLAASNLFLVTNLRADTGEKGASKVTEAPLALDNESWLDRTIAPVTNPIIFEDPRILTEIRPLFMYHNMDNGFVTGGGDLQLYALEIRYALTDKLALLATKDGIIDFHPNVGSDQTDIADISLGLKYALYENPDAEFLLTVGGEVDVPIGAEDVFQGNGAGNTDLFASFLKSWGDWNVVGNLGFIIPHDFNEETSQFHYSLQLDYYLCKHFVPFITLNGYTMLSNGNNIAITTEGSDLINFGASDIAGRTQLIGGVGFRSAIYRGLSLGFAYERSLTTPQGFFEDRFTVDTRIQF